VSRCRVLASEFTRPDDRLLPHSFPRAFSSASRPSIALPVDNSFAIADHDKRLDPPREIRLLARNRPRQHQETYLRAGRRWRSKFPDLEIHSRLIGHYLSTCVYVRARVVCVSRFGFRGCIRASKR